MLLAGAVPAFAGQRLSGTATVAFSGSSTLHDFHGSAPPIAFSLSKSPNGRWSASVELPVVSMNTGNERRDRNMRAMFEAERYPMIRAAFVDIDPEDLRGGASLPFTLTIRETAQATKAALTNWTEAGRHAEFDASFPVSLSDFGLEPPSVLFVRVAETVEVIAHVTLDLSEN